MWLLLKFLLLYFFNINYTFSQKITIKRPQAVPTEWQLLMQCFEKYPILVRSTSFKQYLQMLNENLAQIDDNNLNYLAKGMIYRFLLEVPPDSTSLEKLSPNAQNKIFKNEIKAQRAPCTFFDWTLKSLYQDLSLAINKSHSKVKMEKATLTDVYEDKELAKDLQKIHYTLPWARYIKTLYPSQKLASPVYEAEAWEGYLFSLLKMLAQQASIYKQYAAPSLSPVITFEIISESDLTTLAKPEATLEAPQLPPAPTLKPEQNLDKKLNQLFEEQMPPKSE